MAVSRPEVSVVVPLYNKCGTVLACVESVLAQSIEAFELIVVDDGSTDGSAGRLGHISDRRLRVIRQSNSGVSAARNRGIAEASAELIAFLDADDLWEPSFLAAILQLRSSFPEAGLYATGVGRCWADGRPDLLVSAIVPPGAPGVLIPDYFRALREGDFISSSSVCVPKSVLLEMNGFAEGEPRGEDVDLWSRISLRYPIACHPGVHAFYFTPLIRDERLRKLPSAALPLAVRSLQRLRLEGGIPTQLDARVSMFMDWSLLRQADTLLWQRHREELLQFLAGAPFVSLSARCRAQALSCAARLLPMRIVSFIRWKPARLFHRLAALLALADSGQPLLSSRFVACRHLNGPYSGGVDPSE